jgi:hypothetical protein
MYVESCLLCSAYANGIHHHSSISSHAFPPSSVTVSAADLAYQFRPSGTNAASLSPGIMMASPNMMDRHSGGNGPPIEEASKKRELRLLKNR